MAASVFPHFSERGPFRFREREISGVRAFAYDRTGLDGKGSRLAVP